MSQFVCITGARVKETSWFSNSRNALGGQISHSLQAFPGKVQPVRREDNLKYQRSQPCQNTLFTLFLAYFGGLKRVFDPICESVT